MRRICKVTAVLTGLLALVAYTAGRAISALPPDGGETLIAAGDIAQCGRSGYVASGANATARLIDSLPGTVLALGDLAYPNGAEGAFRGCYQPTWGRFKDRTKPTPGNHDHDTLSAAPYYAYWGDQAGTAGEGFYSFELGAWHIIALNSNILDGPLKSKQEEWLAADLKRHPTTCALAFFHHPRFSSGGHGNDPRLGDLWAILYRQGVDVVLNGHDHDYERFAPQDPDGHRDRQRGIREFVVGTGGAKLTPFLWIRPNSEVRINEEHGILRMTLSSDGYQWEFLSAPDARVLDTGSGKCH
jgi:3',5'-cyclic AMP phosphodiesterase CpdA